MHARICRGALMACLLFTGAALSASDADETIRHVKEVRRLNSPDAASGRPVEITGIVTALSGWRNSFFLDESGTGISVDRTDHAEVRPGDRVEVSGITGAGLFAPIIVAHRVTVLGHGKAPPPHPKLYAELATGREDSQWVEIRGTVRSAAISNSWGRPVLFLRIDTGSGLIMARVHDFANGDYSKLVDATVRVQGVCATNFNERRQFVGLRLFVPDLEHVRIIEAPPADAFALPESSIDSLFRFTSSSSAGHRVRISGIATYVKPGAFLYLESNGQGIAVRTAQRASFEPGTRIEAAGFVASGEYSPVLEDAIVRKLRMDAPPKPAHISASQAIQSNNEFLFAPYDGVLVDIAGEVISQVDHQEESVWYLRDGKTVFEAQLERSSEPASAAALPVGTRVRLTGICSIVTDQNREPKAFRVLLRSPKDILVMSRPWIGPGNALWLIGFLLLSCLVTLSWAVQLRRALLSAPAQAVEPISNLHSRLLSASKWIAISIFAAALVVLVGGWALHIPSLMAMRANTAFSVLFVGLAILFGDDGLTAGRKRIACRACLIACTLLAVLTLTERIAGIDFGMGSAPVLTAVPLSLFALGGLLLWCTRRVLVAQSLIVAAASVCLMNMLGIIYGVPEISGLKRGADVPVVGAVAGLAICVALLFSRPELGIMKIISSDAPGGMLARRLLPAAIFIPTIFGWLRWEGQFRGLYGTNTGLVLFTSANILVFSILTWMNAGLLNRLDIDRLRAKTEGRIAEEANRAKGEFLAIVSHEIRTPMNSILAMANTLQESPLDATQRHYIEVLRRAASSLMTLIDDILDLSKIEAGKLELEHIGFDVKELAEEVIELIEPKARAKGLVLRIHFEEALQTRVAGDPVRLRQVLTNLLGNAVKFTESGWVALTLGRAANQPESIQFAVSDTGIGIPEDKLDAIFGNFTQADSSITRKYGGTGLGLGISRRLVELMGGQIRVSSSPGKGSTFQFTVPFQPAQQNAGQVAEEAEQVPVFETRPVKPLKILVADDSPDNRLVIEAYLKETRHVLTFAEDGERALNKFQGAKFDLVLMDVCMPIMDGLTATRTLRRLEEERALPHTPVIALTANARQEDIEINRSAGCDAYLSKPLSKSKLLEALQQYAMAMELPHAPPTRGQIRINIPAGFEDLTPQYLAARKSEVELSTQALADSNFDRIRTLAHNWKGTGLSYGFDQLTALGAAIEDSAKRHDSAALEKQLAELARYLRSVQLCGS